MHAGDRRQHRLLGFHLEGHAALGSFHAGVREALAAARSATAPDAPVGESNQRRGIQWPSGQKNEWAAGF
jgi:hypothetical protein